MANTKISQLTATTSPTGNEELVYAYNNANGKMTLNTMKTFAGTGKQDTLVSGTNIKTINNTSLLGSGNIDIQGSGGETAFDAIVDASGNGDYTTLGAAITAGKRNIFIKKGTYNESPITIVDDSFRIIGEGAGDVTLNYSITAAAYRVGGACITFSTSTKTSTSDVISHYISGITFNITETGDSDSLSGYLINGDAKSANPTYMCVVDSCNINVEQTGANVRYYDVILEGDITFSNCNIKVTSSSYNVGYYGMNSGRSAQYVGCKLIATSSNADKSAYGYITGNSLIGCSINVSAATNGNASGFLSNVYDSAISISNGGITLQNSSNDKITVSGSTDLNNLKSNTEVPVWAQNTAYSVGDFVQDTTSIYKCNTAHTSGSDFYTDQSKWTYIRGSSLDFVSNCSITVDGLLYIRGICSNNDIGAHNVVLVGDDGGSNNGAMFIGNRTNSGWGNTWTKIIGQTCMCTNNVWKSQDGIRYNDGYHVIKDNIIQAYSSSSYPTVTVVGTNNNHSKVSDNILRYRQD